MLIKEVGEAIRSKQSNSNDLHLGYIMTVNSNDLHYGYIMTVTKFAFSVILINHYSFDCLLSTVPAVIL